MKDEQQQIVALRRKPLSMFLSIFWCYDQEETELQNAN